MGYRIEYHPDTNHKFSTNKDRGRRNMWSVIAVLTIVLILGAVAKNNELLSRLIFPGDPEITQNALSGMLDDVRAGEPVKDAVMAFCVEIIEYAQSNQ